MADDRSRYVPGEIFHSRLRRVYQGDLDWAVNKQRELMAHVVYDAPHENREESGDRRGRGKDFATWIFSEEPGLKENLFSTGSSWPSTRGWSPARPSACISTSRQRRSTTCWRASSP